MIKETQVSGVKHWFDTNLLNLQNIGETLVNSMGLNAATNTTNVNGGIILSGLRLNNGSNLTGGVSAGYVLQRDTTDGAWVVSYFAGTTDDLTGKYLHTTKTVLTGTYDAGTLTTGFSYASEITDTSATYTMDLADIADGQIRALKHNGGVAANELADDWSNKALTFFDGSSQDSFSFTDSPTIKVKKVGKQLQLNVFLDSEHSGAISFENLIINTGYDLQDNTMFFSDLICKDASGTSNTIAFKIRWQKSGTQTLNGYIEYHQIISESISTGVNGRSYDTNPIYSIDAGATWRMGFTQTIYL